MTRLARVVVADVPHHITQRGNRRQRTFFSDEDYETYVRLMVTPGGPVVAEVNDWRAFLATDEDEAVLARLRRHARTGRPLGDAGFIARLEANLGRRLRRRKPGPKAKRKR